MKNITTIGIIGMIALVVFNVYFFGWLKVRPRYEIRPRHKVYERQFFYDCSQDLGVEKYEPNTSSTPWDSVLFEECSVYRIW